MYQMMLIEEEIKNTYNCSIEVKLPKILKHDRIISMCGYFKFIVVNSIELDEYVLYRFKYNKNKSSAESLLVKINKFKKLMELMDLEFEVIEVVRI